MKIDIEYVLKCLKQEKYEDAIKYLDNIKMHDETRLGNNLIRIIVTMNRINNYNKYEAPEVEYTNPRERSISRFFEALRVKDFIEANFLVDDCIEYLKSQYRDYEEMQIYKEVLAYAVEVQRRTIERSSAITRISELTHEIEVYTKSSREVRVNDLYWLIEDMEEIIDLSTSINRNSSRIQYAAGIINTILDFSDGVYRDKDYFGDVVKITDKKEVLNKLYAELESGQYPSAYSSVKKHITYTKNNADWIYKLYHMLLRYLMELLNEYVPKDHTTSKNSVYIVHNQSEEIDYDKLYDDVLKNENEKDVDLLANLVLVRSMQK